MSINTTNKLLVIVENMLGCVSKCRGCILSEEDRASKSSSFGLPQQMLLMSKIRSHMMKRGYSSIELTYGIADHLLLDRDSVDALYQVAVSVLGDVIHSSEDSDRSRMIVSMGVYGKPSKVIERLGYHVDRTVDEMSFVPLFVIDPAMKDRNFSFWEKQIDVIREAGRMFSGNGGDGVDVTLNLSSSCINHITAGEYVDICIDAGVQEILVNWAPMPWNSPETMGNLSKIGDWLCDFVCEIKKHKGAVKSDAVSVVSGLKRVLDGNASLMNVINDMLPSYFYSHIYIDSKGNVLPRLEGIGDVPQFREYGYCFLRNIFESELSDILDDSLSSIKARLLKSVSGSLCSVCSDSSLCVMPGFSVYTDMMKHFGVNIDRALEKSCPHIAKKFLEAV